MTHGEVSVPPWGNSGSIVGRHDKIEYFGRPCDSATFGAFLGRIAALLNVRFAASEASVDTLIPGLRYADRGDMERAGQMASFTARLGLVNGRGDGLKWRGQRAIVPVAGALQERLNFHVDNDELPDARSEIELRLLPGGWHEYRRPPDNKGGVARLVRQLYLDLDTSDPLIRSMVRQEARVVGQYVPDDDRSSQRAIGKVGLVEVSWPEDAAGIPLLEEMPHLEDLDMPENGIMVAFGPVDKVTSYSPKD